MALFTAVKLPKTCSDEINLSFRSSSSTGIKFQEGWFLVFVYLILLCCNSTPHFQVSDRRFKAIADNK